LGKPFVLVLNKMDRVEKERAAVAQARRQLQMSVIPVSVFWPDSVRRILKAIVSACPRALYPLAQNLPGFRRSICKGIVTQAAFGSGLIGAIPIPVGDVIPISAVQVGMLLKLARAHGFRIDRGRAGEILPLLGTGLLVREGCHRLKRAYPEKSTLLSVVVGSGWTYTAGLAAISYFERMAASREALEAEAERYAEPLGL
jgi:GTP-binding protein Era